MPVEVDAGRRRRRPGRPAGSVGGPLSALAPRPAGLDRHVAPAEDLDALGGGELLQHGDRARLVGAVLRKEHQTGRVLPRRRQVEVDHGAVEAVRDLQHDAGAVAGERVGATGTAVIETAERVQTLGDDVVDTTTVHVRDQSETAGVVFVRRVVQALVAGLSHHHEPAPNVVFMTGGTTSALDGSSSLRSQPPSA